MVFIQKDWAINATNFNKEMENAYKLEVPLDVEVGLGQDWLEAH
ncbi:hypothetical protein [uncultured Zobellia sp.]|nr:hypothetical protein [uncultured Zobellia sp.]